MHDSRNRLSAYSGNTYNASTGLPTGSSQTSAMRYDATGRRVSMSSTNGTDLGFLYAGDMNIADIDIEGGSYNGVLRRYIPGAATDERVAMITVNPATGATIAREYYHANRLGSVIAMADETGAITAQYVYTPYGVESPYNASGNPYRYTGRRLDAQWGVYYYRARYYDPQLGRFLETDPAGYVDSMNLYAYVGHDPLNATDPTGRELNVMGDAAYFANVLAMIAVIQETPEGASAIQQIIESDFLVNIAQPGYNAQVDALAQQSNALPNKSLGHQGSAQVDGRNGPGGDTTILFDDNKQTGGADDSGSTQRPPVVGLAHEFGHALDNMEGANSSATDPPPSMNSTPPSEERSLGLENAVRRSLGISERSDYYQ